MLVRGRQHCAAASNGALLAQMRSERRFASFRVRQAEQCDKSFQSLSDHFRHAL